MGEREDRDLIERCHAARDILPDNDEDAELVAFMALFHPEREDNPTTRDEAQRWRGAADG